MSVERFETTATDVEPDGAAFARENGEPGRKVR